MGLQKLHPFDVQKYKSVYLGLLDSGLVKPKQVIAAVGPTNEVLLLVLLP